MRLAEADRTVSSDDDLVFDLPDEDDDPSQTPFQFAELRTGETSSLLRQSRGEYTWALTVVPTTFEARQALATGGEGAYDVSAVVFNRRGVGSPTDLQPLQTGERLTRATVITTGIGGGEVVLTRGAASSGSTSQSTAGVDDWWSDPLGDTSPPWDDFQAGQWVFLFGPHPNSTNERPLLFAQWYRAVAVDDSDGEDTTRARLRVQLRGPDWPWQNTDNEFMENTGEFDPTELSEALHCVIVPDVIAVHTRSFNLQSGVLRAN